MTDPLNIIFDNFGIWLLGYKNEFSCLDIPQGHYFHQVRCDYEVQMNMSLLYFERKSTFNIGCIILRFRHDGRSVYKSPPEDSVRLSVVLNHDLKYSLTRHRPACMRGLPRKDTKHKMQRNP